MNKIVLLRHGESQWNLENRFTGWVDVDLTALGCEEARSAGLLLKKEGYTFDVVFTSVLKRAIKTMWLTLDEMEQLWIPHFSDWRLNERHYGNLQGLNKTEMVKKFGEDQVFKWRRSYDLPPPPLPDDSPLLPSRDPKYRHVDPTQLPKTEALKHCLERVLPFWESAIVPRIKTEKIMIVAHGNSLRALIKHLDQVSESEITGLNIPTGMPLVYELDDRLRPLRHYYLGDPEVAKRKAEAVAQQTKK